jgi:hypothetical protein
MKSGSTESSCFEEAFDFVTLVRIPRSRPAISASRDVLQVFSSGKIRRPLDDVWVLTEGRHPALFLSSLNLRTYSFALQRPA